VRETAVGEEEIEEEDLDRWLQYPPPIPLNTGPRRWGTIPRELSNEMSVLEMRTVLLRRKLEE